MQYDINDNNELMPCRFLVLQPVDDVTGEPLINGITKILRIDTFEKIQSFKRVKNYLFKTFQFKNIHDAVIEFSQLKNVFPVLGSYSEECKDYLNQDNVCLPRWKLSKKNRSILTIIEPVDNKGIIELDNIFIEDFNSCNPEPSLKKWKSDVSLNCDITWQLSASQRFDSDEPKIHIFFEYEQDYPLASRKVHAVSLGGDGSIFNGVNPIYICAPVFVDDDNNVVSDPIKKRVGFIKGTNRKLQHMPEIKKMEKMLRPRGMCVKGNFVDKIVLSFDDILSAKKLIESGKNFHNAHVYLSMVYANKKLSVDEIYDLIMISMFKVFDKDDRWKVRCEELKSICESSVSLFKSDINRKNGIDRVANNYVKKGNEVFTNVDWPPGFCGRLAMEIWQMMHFPNKQIAIIAAHVVIVSFSGRKNSFRNIDMSRSYELLARTGVGKDTPRWSVEMLIDALTRAYNFLENIHLFYPLGRSFGTSALLRSCRNQLSVMIIQSEGGISGKSNSGDQNTLKSFIMQNQSTSAYERLSMPDYSKPLPNIYGVSLTILYESTKESHVARSEMFETGEAGRMNKFYCSHRVDEINRKKREKFSDDILEGIKNMYLEAVRNEDFNAEIVIGKETYTGASLLRVEGNGRVYFKSSPEVEARFLKINQDEIIRRNQDDIYESEREWSEKSRYEFRVMKECLILAYADAGAKTKGISDSNNINTVNFQLETRTVDSDNKIITQYHEMMNLAIVTDEHLNYAEAYINELDRADRANSDDYNADDVQLVSLIEAYCHRVFNKDPNALPQWYIRKQGGTKKAGMFFKRKIIFKSTLMGDGASKMIKHVTKMANMAGAREAHKIIESAFRSGESEGRWLFIKSTHSENLWRVDYLQFNE